MPPQQDAFGQSLVAKLWPGSGYAGAAQSPYLPIVQPLMQSYDSAMMGLIPQSASLGPATIEATGPTPPPGGKGKSSFGALMTLVDPVGGTTFGGNSPK